MRQEFLFCVLLSVLGLFLLTPSVKCQAESPAECSPWNRLTMGVNRAQHHPTSGASRARIGCKDHSLDKCEQIDCGGTYHLDFMNTSFDFCLGVTFHHCDDPPWMELNMSLPDFNSSLHKKVVHNSSFFIPGLSKNLGNNRVDIVLFVKLMNKSDTAYSFTMSGRVRLTTHILGQTITEWPEDLQTTIFSIDTIPVRHCTTRTSTRLMSLRKCVVADYIGNVSSTVTPIVTTTAPHIVVKSPTYNKSCSVGSMKRSQCVYGESCVHSHCRCSYDYALSPHTGMCKYNSNKTRPVVMIPIDFPLKHPSPTTITQQQTSASTGFNRTALIVGGSVGGLVLVAVVIVVVIVMRRRNSQYRGRELLLTEDDTDGAI